MTSPTPRAALNLLVLSQTLAIASLKETLTREFPGINLHCFTELRKTLSFVKKNKPAVIVAEFIYAPTYGSQLSNYEALCAAMQLHSPASRLIALVARQDQKHIERLNDNVRIDVQLDLPLRESELLNAIALLSN